MTQPSPYKSFHTDQGTIDALKHGLQQAQAPALEPAPPQNSSAIALVGGSALLRASTSGSGAALRRHRVLARLVRSMIFSWSRISGCAFDVRRCACFSVLYLKSEGIGN